MLLCLSAIDMCLLSKDVGVSIDNLWETKEPCWLRNITRFYTNMSAGIFHLSFGKNVEYVCIQIKHQGHSWFGYCDNNMLLLPGIHCGVRVEVCVSWTKNNMPQVLCYQLNPCGNELNEFMIRKITICHCSVWRCWVRYPVRGLSVWSLLSLLHVFSRYTGFFPQSRHAQSG